MLTSTESFTATFTTIVVASIKFIPTLVHLFVDTDGSTGANKETLLNTLVIIKLFPKATYAQ